MCGCSSLAAHSRVFQAKASVCNGGLAEEGLGTLEQPMCQRGRTASQSSRSRRASGDPQSHSVSGVQQLTGGCEGRRDGAAHALRERRHLRPEGQQAAGDPRAWEEPRRHRQQAVPARLQRLVLAGAAAGGRRLQRGGVRSREGGT
jgi:hypothetical protein